MATIQGLWAREVLDSRGIPTIECTLWLDTGGIVAASVPTGSSIGKYESVEVRDRDQNRFLGKGVTQAVQSINTQIAPQLIGKDPTSQQEIDQLLINLDGTAKKEKLGSNTLLAVSQAVIKGGALSLNQPLYFYIQSKYKMSQTLKIPTCIYTMVNGGEHGANNLDIQEFQIIAASHLDFSNSLNMAVTMFRHLSQVLAAKNAIHSVGPVGGFTPNLYNNTDVFELLIETAKTTSYVFSQDFFLGVDAAASKFYTGGKYHLRERTEGYSSTELLEYYKKIYDVFRVLCFEDPFREDDEKMWQQITAELGETSRIVSDLLTATNPERTQKAIDKKMANTLLVKPNQIGTMSETIAVIQLAKKAGWQILVSHRSGETNDDLIADFAVGIGADYVKFGPPNRGERTAKYNRLLMIEAELRRSQLATETK
ncbi:MAG TPA: enolase [Candidatus Woesebacteria bacterium]|nr:enolase [Candidatus Woesebacteria bacterium]HNS65560.1 enolase [Candidatus Woesebacteria bacterium]